MPRVLVAPGHAITEWFGPGATANRHRQPCGSARPLANDEARRMAEIVQVVANGLLLGGLYVLIAQGLALIVGVMFVVNLAHGELFLLGSYLAWWLFASTGIGPLTGLPIILLVGFLLGWILCRTIIMRVVEQPPLMALLATFGIATTLIGLMRMVFGTTPRYTSAGYAQHVINVAGIGFPSSRLTMFIVAMIMTFSLWLFLTRTRIGKSIRAAAQDKDAARLVGINLTTVYCTAFGIGTGMVFVAGALFSATQGFTPVMGFAFTIKAFAVVVLGGLGRMGGTILAGLLLGVTESLISSYVPGIGAGLGIAVAFILMIVVLAARPEGLLRGANI